ncbi:MAG: hypothetical protein LBQ24_01330 [Candidatus Peribacteria bacterium]|jgi:hypothetical protein|nr:hypothetical protein [Candidatus Peribacteria bacterium]
MKKIIIFALIFVLNLSLVNADILPDITRDQKIISGKNILNVADYPEWTFFQKAFKYGEDLFEIIPDN